MCIEWVNYGTTYILMYISICLLCLNVTLHASPSLLSSLLPFSFPSVSLIASMVIGPEGVIGRLGKKHVWSQALSGQLHSRKIVESRKNSLSDHKFWVVKSVWHWLSVRFWRALRNAWTWTQNSYYRVCRVSFTSVEFILNTHLYVLTVHYLFPISS